MFRLSKLVHSVHPVRLLKYALAVTAPQFLMHKWCLGEAVPMANIDELEWLLEDLTEFFHRLLVLLLRVVCWLDD